MQISFRNANLYFQWGEYPLKSMSESYLDPILKYDTKNVLIPDQLYDETDSIIDNTNDNNIDNPFFNFQETSFK